MYLGEDGPISPRFNMEDDDFMQLGPCGPSGDEDMGEMADYYMNLAMDNDEPWVSPYYENSAGTYLRDPLHYHVKVFAKEVNSTTKAVLIEWSDRDKPVKVWVPKKCIKAQGPGYFFIWKKFWMAKQEEMNWTAEVQEEHSRQKQVESAICSFVPGNLELEELEEMDCSHLVTRDKKKPNASCRKSESADCSNMVSERHKRKKARQAEQDKLPPMSELDEFGGF